MSKNGESPQRGNQDTAYGSKGEHHKPLRPLHDACLAVNSQTLSPGSRITHHEGPNKGREAEEYALEIACPKEGNRKADQETAIGIAVKVRIEKRAEKRGPALYARYNSVEDVEYAAADKE